MLDSFARFLKVLNSETEPGQISLALAFAMVAGFTPLLSLHNLLIILMVLVLRVNISAFIVGLTVFTGLAYLLDPLFHQTGYSVLNNEALKELWTAMYNNSIWRLERFNNTIVMGSLLFSLLAFVPFVLTVNYLIVRYRTSLLQWVEKLRIVKLIKGSKFYSIYQSLSGLTSS